MPQEASAFPLSSRRCSGDARAPAADLSPAIIQDVAPTIPKRQRLLVHLHELVDALDRRVPHLEREGEVQIAGEAAALKQKALDLIAALEAQSD